MTIDAKAYSDHGFTLVIDASETYLAEAAPLLLPI